MMTTKSPAKLTKAEVFALEMVMTTAMEKPVSNITHLLERERLPSLAVGFSHAANSALLQKNLRAFRSPQTQRLTRLAEVIFCISFGSSKHFKLSV